MKKYEISNITSGSSFGIYEGNTVYEALIQLNNNAGGTQEDLDNLIESAEIYVEEIEESLFL